RTLLGFLGAAPLAPPFHVRRRRRERRREKTRPVEQHARILRLDAPPHLVIEGRPSDLDARRRAKPVQNSRGSLPATLRRGLHQVEMFVAAAVAIKPQDGG